MPYLLGPSSDPGRLLFRGSPRGIFSHRFKHRSLKGDLYLRTKQDINGRIEIWRSFSYKIVTTTIFVVGTQSSRDPEHPYTFFVDDQWFPFSTRLHDRTCVFVLRSRSLPSSRVVFECAQTFTTPSVNQRGTIRPSVVNVNLVISSTFLTP